MGHNCSNLCNFSTAWQVFSIIIVKCILPRSRCVREDPNPLAELDAKAEDAAAAATVGPVNDEDNEVVAFVVVQGDDSDDINNDW